MRFAYRPVHVAGSPLAGGGMVFRPMVALRVEGPKDAVHLWTLLDTGADHTILPLSMADALGIKTQQGSGTIHGLNSTPLPIETGEVVLQISDGRQSFLWTTTVGFVQFTEPEHEVVLLGRGGCLEFFRATFDGDRRQVELVPVPGFPGSVIS